jgi:hypothetical protein
MLLWQLITQRSRVQIPPPPPLPSRAFARSSGRPAGILAAHVTDLSPQGLSAPAAWAFTSRAGSPGAEPCSGLQSGKPHILSVGQGGLEPPRGYPHQLARLERLPFRHCPWRGTGRHPAPLVWVGPGAAELNWPPAPGLLISWPSPPSLFLLRDPGVRQRSSPGRSSQQRQRGADRPDTSGRPDTLFGGSPEQSGLPHATVNR